MTVNRAEVAAYFHARMAHDDRFGYTQGPGRWGSLGTEEWELNGVKGLFVVGDRDCSSSVCDCWQEALRGSSFEGALAGATYTGNMRMVFVGSGLFDWHPTGDGYIPQKGDVLLNEEYHTAMAQSPDVLTEAVGNEWGGNVGGEVGDQTGGEFIENAMYWRWDGILAYNHKADEEPPRQQPGEPVNDSQLWYRAHVMNLGWLDAVRDGQECGTVGHALRMEALKITPPKGMRLNVKTHIQDEGWRTYVGVEKGGYDPEMGTTGKAQRLECIEIDVTENPKRLKVFYRVHIADFGWTDWIPEGYAAGTVGCGKAIEAIQIVAE